MTALCFLPLGQFRPSALVFFPISELGDSWQEVNDRWAVHLKSYFGLQHWEWWSCKRRRKEREHLWGLSYFLFPWTFFWAMKILPGGRGSWHSDFSICCFLSWVFSACFFSSPPPPQLYWCIIDKNSVCLGSTMWLFGICIPCKTMTT